LPIAPFRSRDEIHESTRLPMNAAAMQITFNSANTVEHRFKPTRFGDQGLTGLPTYDDEICFASASLPARSGRRPVTRYDTLRHGSIRTIRKMNLSAPTRALAHHFSFFCVSWRFFAAIRCSRKPTQAKRPEGGRADSPKPSFLSCPWPYTGDGVRDCGHRRIRPG